MASSEDLAMSAWRSMIRATLTGKRVMHAQFEDRGITGPQFGVIRVVGEAGPEGVKLSDISRELHVTSANVTGLVDRLEESGYLTREPDPADRRVLLARLTADGREFLEQVIPAHRAFVARVMSCLSAEEQAGLADLLSRVAAHAIAIARPEASVGAGDDLTSTEQTPRELTP